MKDSITQAYKQVLEQQEQLEEGKLKDIAITLGIAGALTAGGMHYIEKGKQQHISQAMHKLAKQDPEHLKKTVLAKFNIEPKKAEEIVNAAIRHADPVFPKAHHLLALAGIESSFNEKAVSKLKHDPARGLLQVRPMVWNIPHKELSTIDGQMKHGANILKTYHQKLGDPEKAVQAYNIGIANLNKGQKQDAASRYLTKFKTELHRYTD